MRGMGRMEERRDEYKREMREIDGWERKKRRRTEERKRRV
jgi:hypothetical protein